MGKDLGTYYLRVELHDGRGWISKWETSARYTNGSEHESPLSATRIEPNWDDEASLLEAMWNQYEWGNYSCDCNKTLFWCRAQRLEEPECAECGDTMVVERLTAIRPDGSEVVLKETP